MSFLEKLKKNIGVEEESSEILANEDKTEKSEKKQKAKKKKVKIKEEIEETIIEDKKRPSFAKATEGEKKWFEQKGELAIDVYQTKTDLVIQSAVAGVRPENLDIVIENDVLTIEGNRKKPNEDEEKNYFYQECYWGPFYKRMILQEEVDNSRVEAIMKDGILTIRIPKIQRKKKRKVTIKT